MEQLYTIYAITRPCHFADRRRAAASTIERFSFFRASCLETRRREITCRSGSHRGSGAAREVLARTTIAGTTGDESRENAFPSTRRRLFDPSRWVAHLRVPLCPLARARARSSPSVAASANPARVKYPVDIYAPVIDHVGIPAARPSAREPRFESSSTRDR